MWTVLVLPVPFFRARSSSLMAFENAVKNALYTRNNHIAADGSVAFSVASSTVWAK
jgi:hypothetical protein